MYKCYFFKDKTLESRIVEDYNDLPDYRFYITIIDDETNRQTDWSCEG